MFQMDSSGRGAREWKTSFVTRTIGAAALLATGTTTVLVTKLVFHSRAPRPDESIWNINSASQLARLDRLPPMLVIRQRPGPAPALGGVSLSFGDKLFEKEMSLKRLVSAAYRRSGSRIIVPDGFSQKQFDVLLTFVDRPNERFQEGVEKQLGLAAHRETRETDVLLLRVKDANAPGLHRSPNPQGKPATGIRRGEIRFINEPLTSLASHLEAYLDIPVLDRTGLSGRFDMDLRWNQAVGNANRDAFQQALQDQLGLELVPSREPIEMLVVERAN